MSTRFVKRWRQSSVQLTLFLLQLSAAAIVLFSFKLHMSGCPPPNSVTREISYSQKQGQTRQLTRNELEIIGSYSFQIDKSISTKHTVILTAATYHYHLFLKNLGCFVHQRANRDIVVFALDEQTAEHTKRDGTPYIAWYDTVKEPTVNQSYENSRPHSWGTKEFNSVSLQKLEIVRAVLKAGFHVIFTDIDVVWCDDIPRQFAVLLRKFPSFDIYIQSNAKNSSSRGEPNTGFYFAKSTSSAIALYDRLSQGIQDINDRTDDQTLFWKEACKSGRHLNINNGLTDFEDGAHEFDAKCEWGNGRVKILYLPLSKFPNGSRDRFGRPLYLLPPGYYGRLCRNRQISIWHANYMKGPVKQPKLRQQNLWLLFDNGTCSTI